MKARKKRAIKWYMIFTVPGLLIYTIFMIVPIIMSVIISLTNWTGMTQLSQASFVGLKNYASLLKDPILKVTINNTLVYGMIMMLIVPVIAFVLAYVVETFVQRKSLWRTIAYLPAMIPLIVTVFLWKWIYNPQYGLLNAILKAVGLGEFVTGWITNSSTALFAVTFTSIWKAIPGVFVLFMAGLQSVPKELEEAAMLDGANRLQVIRNVTIPSMKKIITIIYVLQFIDVFRVFDLVYAMTNGGPGYYTTEMILTYGYKTTFTNSNAGYGMAITTVLIIFVTLMSSLQLKVAGRSDD